VAFSGVPNVIRSCGWPFFFPASVFTRESFSLSFLLVNIYRETLC